MHSVETNSTTNVPSQKGPIKKFFYYGLAVDSIGRSLSRSAKISKSGWLFFLSVKNGLRKTKSAPLQIARDRADVAKTMDNAGEGLLVIFSLIIFFLGLAIWQFLRSNELASITLFIVTLCYGFKFFAYLLIWTRSRDYLEQNQ